MKTEIYSFIVISYNRPKDTRDVLENILFLVAEVENIEKDIIIINNQSTKEYSELTNYIDRLAPEQKEKVRYHLSDENLGVPRGRNLGMKMAKGETLLFIDDDATFIEPGVISKTQEIFKEKEVYDNVKIIAFREQNYFNKEYVIATKDKNRAKEKSFYTNYFIGCGHAIKRDLIEKVGYYIESFQYGVEEYDLAYKTLDAGYKIYYTSEVTVLHRKSIQGRASKGKTAQWQYQNKMIIAYKYLPWRYVFSHWIMWSSYYLFHTKGNIFGWFKHTLALPSLMRVHPRKVISAETQNYIQKVKGRLSF